MMTPMLIIYNPPGFVCHLISIFINCHCEIYMRKKPFFVELHNTTL
ncbi:Intraflagellar transport protein 80 [Daphnia magna]|uniref:Intraflagellar transport protein 80 n=1 Tax=Daphnia magna TaxID=35525 RepID=A0A164I8Q8_9CRUS|nr:Intraflagellar transport protein 80 [Daphnia magna]